MNMLSITPHIPGGLQPGTFVDDPNITPQREKFPPGCEIMTIELAPGHRPVRIGYFPGRCFQREVTQPELTTNPKRREIHDYFIFYNKKGTRLRKRVLDLIPSESVINKFTRDGLAGLLEGEKTLVVQSKACLPKYQEYLSTGDGEKAFPPAYILLDEYWKKYGDRTKIPDTMTLNHIKAKGSMVSNKSMLWLHELCATRWVIHNDAINNPDGIFWDDLEQAVRAANDIMVEIQSADNVSISEFNKEITLEECGGNEELLNTRRELQKLKKERAGLIAQVNAKSNVVDRSISQVEQSTIETLKKSKELSQPQPTNVIADKIPQEQEQKSVPQSGPVANPK